MSNLEEYLLVVDEPKYIKEFYDMRSAEARAIDYVLIVEQFQKLLGVYTSTEALSKIAVLMREESEVEIELNKYKKLVNFIYEVVSVNCNDVGEAFAGIQNDIEELRKETFPANIGGLTPRAVGGATLCEHGKGHCQCDNTRCRNYCD